MTGEPQKRDGGEIMVPTVGGAALGAGAFKMLGGAGVAMAGTGFGIGLGGFMVLGAIAGAALYGALRAAGDRAVAANTEEERKEGEQ